MIFSKSHIDLILAGEKTQTRRRRIGDKPAAYRVGADYALQRGRGKPGIGPRIFITACEIRGLGEVTDEDARAEGYDNAAEYINVYSGLNNCTVHAAEAHEVYVYTFHVVEEKP